MAIPTGAAKMGLNVRFLAADNRRVSEANGTPSGARTGHFNAVDRQRRWLTSLVGVLLAAMCATLVLVSGLEDLDGPHLATRWPALVGLVGLVTIFVLYIHHKQRELSRLEVQLRDSAVREAEVRARFAELSFLFDTSTQLQLRLDLPSMLELAAQRLIRCLDATQSSIILRNEETGLLEVRAAAGVDVTLVTGATMKPGEGIAGVAFSEGQTLILTPELMAERFPTEIKRGRSIASALSVPLRFRGTPIGVVNVARASGEPFGEIHARMLETFAEHCAATVLKTAHHHELLRQVQTKKVA